MLIWEIHGLKVAKTVMEVGKDRQGVSGFSICLEMENLLLSSEAKHHCFGKVHKLG